MNHVMHVFQFVLRSKATMDPRATGLVFQLAANSDATNVAEWFDRPPHLGTAPCS